MPLKRKKRPKKGMLFEQYKIEKQGKLGVNITRAKNAEV